jgi:hypothetical protein
MCESLLRAFRSLNCCYPAGYSILGNLGTIIRSWFVPYSRQTEGRALQTSYLWLFGRWGDRVIGQARRDGSAVHVFVSSFLGQSLDQGTTVDEARIDMLLSQGVDGIMTDRPTAVRNVISRWKAKANRTAVDAPEGVTEAELHDGPCRACEMPALP